VSHQEDRVPCERCDQITARELQELKTRVNGLGWAVATIAVLVVLLVFKPEVVAKLVEE